MLVYIEVKQTQVKQVSKCIVFLRQNNGSHSQ